MTVQELIDALKKENPNALVYTMDEDSDVAFLITDVVKNILEGKDDTIVIR